MTAQVRESAVEALLRRGLTDSERQSLPELADNAFDVVEGYLGGPIPDPVPSAVVRVAGQVVAALLARPSDVPTNSDSLTAGPYAIRFATGSTSLAPWLTAAQKLALDPWRRSMASMPLAGEAR